MIYHKEIDHGKGFDWGKASEDYAKYRDIYPPEFYRRIADSGLCVRGQKVLDIGTGTGVLPRNMAEYGAEFTGADVSENQIRFARELTKKRNLDIRYIVSPAENLDFPEHSFDVITACQCFMYFDKSVVLPNIYRMLKPGGRFAVLFMAWLPDESRIAEESEKLVLKYNPSWTGGGMRRYELAKPEWAEPYFDLDRMDAYDVNVPFTRESWNGRILSCRGIGASLPEDRIREFKKEHLALLSEIAPEKFEILHYATMLVVKAKK